MQFRVNAIPIFGARWRSGVWRRDPALWDNPCLINYSQLLYLIVQRREGGGEQMRLRRVVAISARGSLCAPRAARAFPNLLGTRVTDSTETEGNCTSFARWMRLGTCRGIRCLLFPLCDASELLRIKRCYTVSCEINRAPDPNERLTHWFKIAQWMEWIFHVSEVASVIII